MGDSSASDGATARFASAERLMVFTDAVVAIAMTLLVLPLLESISQAAQLEGSAANWLKDHVGQLISFGVSFGVSASFWLVHHRLFEHVRRQSPRFMLLNLIWLLAFVFLQVPAAMVYALPADRAMIGLYIGTMAVNSALLMSMTWYALRHPELCETPVPASQMTASAILTALFLLALVVGVAFPAVNYFALLVLLLTSPLHRLVVRRPRRPSPLKK